MLFAILVTASPVQAQLATDDCNGLDFDAGKPVVGFVNAGSAETQGDEARLTRFLA